MVIQNKNIIITKTEIIITSIIIAITSSIIIAKQHSVSTWDKKRKLQLLLVRNQIIQREARTITDNKYHKKYSITKTIILD
jgi:hypothetical protein